MKVSVVVTVFNEEESIGKLLEGLLAQTKVPNEIIIVDGGSADITVQNISEACHFVVKVKSQKYKAKVKIFIKPGNRSVGRNEGIKQARNEIIAITDAGCYPKKDWLEKLITPFENPDVHIVSGYYAGIARTSFEEAAIPYFLVMPDRALRQTEFLPSARSMAIRKSAWEKVGGFPEEFSHNEDLVFSHRLKEAGFSFAFSREAIVYWYPPKNLKEAAIKFFRFSLGDAQSGVSRPKVYLIFLRYFLGLFAAMVYGQVAVWFLVAYVVWAISKNLRYVSSLQQAAWLVTIQIVSDICVMLGWIRGKATR